MDGGGGSSDRAVALIFFVMRRYTITFTTPETPDQPVDVDDHEIAGGYLWLWRIDGTLGGLFLLEVVKEWTYIDNTEPSQS